MLALAGPFIDFATVNVSSPNTERLRDLQGKAALAGLLAGVGAANARLARPVPLFLKIAPDLGEAELADVAEAALDAGIAGIVATNTTLARDGLASRHAGEAGGLSGAPLFRRSTAVLARLHAMTEGRLPLIGVGGVGSAEDAYAKIRAGASAVQLYTALVYERPRAGAAHSARPRRAARPRRVRHRGRRRRHRPRRVGGPGLRQPPTTARVAVRCHW